MKGLPKQVRFDSEVEAEVKKIAELTGLPDVEIIRQMVRAGTNAVKENNYRMELPLHFEVIPGEAKKSSSLSSTSHQNGGDGDLKKHKPPKAA